MQININSCKSVTAEDGENLLETLVRNHISITNVCNGKGSCGKCKIRFVDGIPDPSVLDRQKLNDKELEQGIRLACSILPRHGMAIRVDGEQDAERKRMPLVNLAGGSCDSGLRTFSVKLDKPSLIDERGDWDRVSQSLTKQSNIQTEKIDLSLLEKLPQLLRASSFSINVMMWKDQVVDFYPGSVQLRLYGIAIDIGTSSVAIALVDLDDSRIIRVVSCENSQTMYGADVITRINFANERQANRRLLREMSLGTINKLLHRLCTEENIDSDQIYKVTIVANTAMHHLFLGLDIKYLASAPFASVCNTALEFKAGELGLALNSRSRVLLFPNVGGFIGGDLVGVLLAFSDELKQGQHLLLDIGTNCELIVKHHTGMIACSTAAGPAFEAAYITHGSLARPGAIESVRINDCGVQLKVIDGVEASSICGSGLIEAVQQMRLAGIINSRGAFQDPENHSNLSPALRQRIQRGNHGWEFVLAYGATGHNVVLNQQDIRQLQLAKATVCAGIKTLLEIVGMRIQDLDSIILAGTFAAYLDLQSMLDIGLVPLVEIGRIKVVGNAAHLGAAKALVDHETFNQVVQLVKKIRHVQLAGNSIFLKNLIDSMGLKVAVVR